MKQCKKILDLFNTCKLYNPIRIKSMRHTQANHNGKLVGYDIIGPYEDAYVITAIDYFSRQAFAETLKIELQKEYCSF